MSTQMANTKTAAEKQLYMQLNASELTAIIMKGSPNSNDRDAGFCSGSSDGGDDLSIDHSRLEPSSPTDASEDSVEVKVTPIALIRNKRKSSEPSKVVCEREEAPAALSTAPLKKRIRYTSTTDSAVVLTPPAAATPPPQLWDSSQVLPHELMPNPAQVFVRHPGVTTLHRVPATDADAPQEQQEPLALVLKKQPTDDDSTTENAASSSVRRRVHESVTPALYMPKKLQRRYEAAEGGAPQMAHCSATTTATKASTTCTTATPAAALALTVRSQAKIEATAATDNATESAHRSASSSTHIGASNSSTTGSVTASRPQQRNYKNMTRERRIEANARERTRVHTISAAYETLRRSVPAYSNAQKLSKLSVLRVACSYILTLSRMAGHDYSADQSAPSIADCFDLVTETIQTEGKIRKKKDE